MPLFDTVHQLVLAETLTDPTPCLPPGFAAPVGIALGWVKGLSLVVGVVALVRIGVHILRQQGDGVPDRDDTFDKMVNWVIGIFLAAGALAILSALGLSVTSSC